MRKHQQTTATMEGNDYPAAMPRNSIEPSKPSICAKFDSASAATPANVMARQTDSVQLEFDHLCVDQAPISRSSCPIHWWPQHKPSYLILSSVAWTMLCVPATSVVAIDRVFFQSRWRITCKRNTLAPSEADTVIFWWTICDCCIAVRPLGFWRSCYVTKYVGLCSLSLSDLDFSVAI